MERLIRRRRETPEIGWGSWKVLRTNVPGVLAHRCDWEGRAIVAAHNLGDQPCVVRVRLGDVVVGARLDDLLDERGALTEIKGESLELKMDGYGFRWFRMLSPDQHTPP
jgi:maltose alpha-D-glucosyltransferase / alpha-amylase